MPVYVSYHTANASGTTVPKYNKGDRLEMLGPATSFETKTPAVTANSFTQASENTLVRIANHGSNTKIALLGNTSYSANTTNTEYWPDGRVENRYLPNGYFISIIL